MSAWPWPATCRFPANKKDWYGSGKIGTWVATYWPEFGCNGKERILVRHLLSHEAGLHAMRPWIRHSEEMLDWDHVVSSLAKSRPAYEPGTQNGYHAISYGWYVGEIVRRVSGKQLDEFVQDELVGPLGLLLQPVNQGYQGETGRNQAREKRTSNGLMYHP